MPTSRFLKKKQRRTDLDTENVTANVLPSYLKENRSETNLTEWDAAVGKERSTIDSNTKLWKLKDEDFVSGIKKRLNHLTNSLSPSSSPSFTASSSTSSKLRSKADANVKCRSGNALLPHEQTTRATYVPTVNLERPKVLSDRGTAGSSRNYGMVRTFLLDRQCTSGSYREDYDSDMIRSLYEIVQATGNDHTYSTDYYGEPRSAARQELAEFSNSIGRLRPPYGREDYLLDGKDFWTRLATCKEELMRTEYLVNRTFIRSRDLEEHAVVSPRHQTIAYTSLPLTSQVRARETQVFTPAEEAIRWAHRQRFKILDS